MIIISGTFEVDPAEIDLARTVFATMAEASSADKGCLAYGFWVDPEISYRYRAYEEWESEDAIRAHMTTAHAAAFIQALPKLRIRSSSVWRYQATRMSKVGFREATRPASLNRPVRAPPPGSTS